ncbi:hypothetical protein [Argonema galeatum]|uniref:hypothetical protein n=1 Tax=Argonema galeatum TaxID=2942762 RepID=UPI0020129C96|nr:hypothetical protein [Argonema galeatum]MCL1468609.1 hypothetical protein [Argonema galeatum A003/A1]
MLEFDSNNSADTFTTANSAFTNQSELQQIRANYCKEVKGIAEFVKQLIAGRTEEEITEEEIERIARQAHSLRREIGIKYKELTPQQKLDAIYVRNLKKYGDSLGPTIEYLRTIGKTWLQIIESASRPNPGDINDILREG